MIGNVTIPDPLFDRMSRSAMVKVESGRELRIKRLVDEYSKVPEADLISAIEKISEKLGGTNTRTALAAIETGDYNTVAGLALLYYDKSYSHSLQKRANPLIRTVNTESNDPVKNAALVLEAGKCVILGNPEL
jgi:tRNA 2-selenouridine synthase